MLHRPNRRPQFFYTTAPLPCPYLPGRTERKIVTELSGPDAEALRWSDEKGEAHVYSWAELRQRSIEAAHALGDAGVQRGDRVLVMLPRVPEWWFIALGAIRAGFVLVPGTSMLTAHDLRYRLETARVTTVTRVRPFANRPGRTCTRCCMLTRSWPLWMGSRELVRWCRDLPMAA